MQTAPYVHIFTDGLDKLLSASVWFNDWGDRHSFLYYSNNKLKGYASTDGILTLSRKGIAQLHDPQFITTMFQKANDITQHSNLTHQKVNDLGNDDLGLREIFLELVNLLQQGYSLYFNTEEYMTQQLKPEKDKDLISHIGHFRLEFIETNVALTEDLYEVAARIVQKLDLRHEDVQSLTWQEVLAITSRDDIASTLDQRKQAFFLEKEPTGLACLAGEAATNKYTHIIGINNPQQREFHGLGASVGQATGTVFKVSVSDKKLENKLALMKNTDILVVETTQPKFTPFMKKISGVVTDEGGILSHAAIIAREFGIPCVVGTRTATDVLQTGQSIYIDGKQGIVRIL